MDDTGFTPKRPGGVANPGSPGGPSPTDDGSNVAWYATPDASHIARFKYLDIRLFPVLKKFPGRLGAVSVLYVSFKDKSGGLTATYAYGFADPDQGQAITDAMVASPHPYGEVLHPRVIKAGVPYTRM